MPVVICHSIPAHLSLGVMSESLQINWFRLAFGGTTPEGAEVMIIPYLSIAFYRLQNNFMICGWFFIALASFTDEEATSSTV